MLLSIGMSNTSQEFCSAPGEEPCTAWSFMGQAAEHPDVDEQYLVIVNGTRSGQAAVDWDDPTDANYDRVRDDVLAPRGLSEAQVQAVWIKQARARPQISLPDPGADAYQLEAALGDIVRAVGVRTRGLRARRRDRTA